MKDDGVSLRLNERGRSLRPTCIMRGTIQGERSGDTVFPSWYLSVDSSSGSITSFSWNDFLRRRHPEARRTAQFRIMRTFESLATFCEKETLTWPESLEIFSVQWIASKARFDLSPRSAPARHRVDPLQPFPISVRASGGVFRLQTATGARYIDLTIFDNLSSIGHTPETFTLHRR